ncbi:hypothetical protein KM043_011307 [Ampulex compressa]|nr:hypothetical protein KM043_011307 [Ampulex compressa]
MGCVGALLRLSSYPRQDFHTTQLQASRDVARRREASRIVEEGEDLTQTNAPNFKRGPPTCPEYNPHISPAVSPTTLPSYGLGNLADAEAIFYLQTCRTVGEEDRRMEREKGGLIPRCIENTPSSGVPPVMTQKSFCRSNENDGDLVRGAANKLQLKAVGI